MPEYRYRCPLGHETDVVHSMMVDPAIICSTCGGPMHRKPMGGGGFYYNPGNIILGWMNENFERKRQGLRQITRRKVTSLQPLLGGNRHRPIRAKEGKNG